MSRSTLAASCAAVLVGVVAPRAESAGPPLPLKVVGTELRNSRDEPVVLRGVNTAGLEWSSNGEGRILETVRRAIRDWRANVVRLPLSQDRWFGKTPEQSDGGEAYRGLVREAVETCSSAGCYIILDLHWSNAGEWGKQIGQHVMPDQHSVAFWKDLAAAYRDHPAVLFNLYNEPHDVSWDVWLKGGTVTEKPYRRNPAKTFEAVGMRTLLDTVRATGARNVVIVGGLDWSYDFSGILEGRRLKDPEGNGVVYDNHAYPFKGETVDQWIARMEKAAKALPVIVGEFGADPRLRGGESGETWVRRVLQALEDHNWSWIAWDLHPSASPCLIADWSYTPTPHFGVWVQKALAGELPPRKGPAAKSGAVGILEGHGDIGIVLHGKGPWFRRPDHSHPIPERFSTESRAD
jgi:endoglucanase